MAAYRRVYSSVTCRLTACTQGSAPGPTLGKDYGKLYVFSILPVPTSLSELEVNKTSYSFLVLLIAQTITSLVESQKDGYVYRV